ncbi:MAG: HPP family protein [Janthinobacterium lividum]
MDASRLLPPMLIAATMVAIAALSAGLGEAWLVPSLGSAVFAQALGPEQPSAQPYTIGVGQLLGVAAGMAGVFLAGAGHAPAFMGEHVAWVRVAAVGIAMPLAAAAQMLAQARTPVGGATALVVALGAETASWGGAGRLVVGIALVTAIGEGVRRAVLRAR